MDPILVPPFIGAAIGAGAILLELVIMVFAAILVADEKYIAGLVIGFIAGIGCSVGAIALIANLAVLLLLK